MDDDKTNDVIRLISESLKNANPDPYDTVNGLVMVAAAIADQMELSRATFWDLVAHAWASAPDRVPIALVEKLVN